MKQTEYTLENVQVDRRGFGVGNGLEKPQHYSKGIDTFARMEANCTKEECLAFVRGNLDKYTWRDKGQDLEDFEKIIAYAKWGIKLLQS